VKKGVRGGSFLSMNGLACSVEEQIKWRDAMDVFRGTFELRHLRKGLAMARACAHPDAKWLVSLFAQEDEEELTEEGVKSAFAREGEDPRALTFLSALDYDSSKLRRAAELGYAPAQVKY
jgi:hypothetical protein